MTCTRSPYPGEYAEPQPVAVDIAGDPPHTLDEDCWCHPAVEVVTRAVSKASVTTIRGVLRMIADDAEADAVALDSTPFTPRGMGETFGNVLAMVASLANCVDALAAKIESEDLAASGGLARPAGEPLTGSEGAGTPDDGGREHD